MTAIDKGPPSRSSTAVRPLASARRAFGWLAGSAAVYLVLATASHGGCVGGVDAGGGFIDASGGPTTTAPVCTDMTMGPSPVVPIILAGLFLWALSAAARDPSRSARVFRRAARIGVVISIASIVIGNVWFFSLPLEHRDLQLLPPFVSGVTIDVSPMSTTSG